MIYEKFDYLVICINFIYYFFKNHQKIEQIIFNSIGSIYFLIKQSQNI